jgi:NitT/TauT family transport system substrate-binding protein
MIKAMSRASIKKSTAHIVLIVALALSPGLALSLERVVFATDWKAQAEQGGFYQAKAMGLYEKAGLDVRIHGGGPGINVPQLLGAGAIDFGMGSNSFIPLNMVRAGVPAKAVMAAFQKDPQVLISHPREDVKSLDDMRGKPIMIADATIGAFWVWLRAKFGFENSQIRKYTFNLAPFLVDPTAIQQGYVTSEPYTIETMGGVKPQVFLLSDYGYPGYAAMVLARNSLIDERPELVAAFVEASIEGWAQYLYGDASSGDTLIKASNPDMTDAQLAFAREQMRARHLVLTPEAEKNGIGAMTEERWNAFFTIMSEQGIYPKELNWRDAFTLRFLNPRQAQLPADR